jgi:spore coat polysaccharide biosynthesis predicted glycosyltransferase SpsG
MEPLVMVLTESGSRIGLGHLGRCLAISEELAGQVAFAVEGPESEGRESEGPESAGMLAAAGGVTAAAASAPAPVVLIDRRDPTAAGELAGLHEQGRRVCLLDDPGEARAGADLVIDPPTGCAWPPTGGRRLAGFEHVLLRRDIRAAAKRPLPGVELLLSMGGSDPEGLTPALAQALQATGASVLTVLGPLYRGPAPAGSVLDNPEDWPRALAGARLLVGRFGHTLLEAAHLGTPALAVATGERAGDEAEAFAAHGTIDVIRVHGPGDARAVAERALALLADGTRLAAMAWRGRELIDGRGAVRVADALRELALSPSRPRQPQEEPGALPASAGGTRGDPSALPASAGNTKDDQ